MRRLQRLNERERFSGESAVTSSHAGGCQTALFSVQVVKSLLDFKDEQLAVQLDSHDSLWGETGRLLLVHRLLSPLSVTGILNLFVAAERLTQANFKIFVK